MEDKHIVKENRLAVTRGECGKARVKGVKGHICMVTDKNWIVCGEHNAVYTEAEI